METKNVSVSWGYSQPGENGKHIPGHSYTYKEGFFTKCEAERDAKLKLLEKYPNAVNILVTSTEYDYYSDCINDYIATATGKIINEEKGKEMKSIRKMLDEAEKSQMEDFEKSLTRVERNLERMLSSSKKSLIALTDTALNRLQLINNKIAGLVYGLVGSLPLTGTIEDHTRKVDVNWTFVVIKHDDNSYDISLRFETISNSIGFVAWLRTDRDTISTYQDIDKQYGQTVRRYYDYLSIWLANYIHNDGIVNMLRDVLEKCDYIPVNTPTNDAI